MSTAPDLRKNESGRSVLEIIAVIAVMGLLSLTIAYGYILAQRRQAAGEVVNLVTKSSAGVITSRVLDNMVAAYQGSEQNRLEIDEALPTSTYISNVMRVEEGSQEAKLYGLEAIQAPMGTVISAHALKSGRGVVIKTNQLSTHICKQVLTAGMAYEGVWDFGAGVIYDWERLEANPDLIDRICDGEAQNEAGLKNVLDVGFIFRNTGLPDDKIPSGGCNTKCAVDILGECGLKENPECREEACERKYYDIQNCAWKCYDGQGDKCECVNSVWFESEKKCVSCLTNKDCYDRDETLPVCNNPGTESQCEGCPSDTLYNTSSEQCEDCITLTNGAKPFYLEKEGVKGCVECILDTDCSREDEPVCIENVCRGCKTQTDCEGTETCDVKNHTCESCPGNKIGDPATNKCICPSGLKENPSNKNQCVECVKNADCSGDEPVCDAVTNTCQPCPEDKPFWKATTQQCVECLSDEVCEDKDWDLPYCKKNVCSPIECAYIGKGNGFKINSVWGDACNRFSTSYSSAKTYTLGGTFADRKTCNPSLNGVLYYHRDQTLSQVTLASHVSNGYGRATLAGKDMLKPNDYSFKAGQSYPFSATAGSAHNIPSGVTLKLGEAKPDLICH